jgi:hypothetical protein
MLRLARRPPFIMTLTMIYGVVALFLITTTDSTWIMSLLGVLLALLCVLHVVYRLGHSYIFQPRLWIPGIIFLGAFVGAGGVGATMLILLIKMSLQNTMYLDYPLIAGMTERLPTWTVAGGLIGLAMALVLYGRGGSDGDLS